MRKTVLVLAALLLALPAAAQLDLSRFVQIGDSLSAGYLDGCWVQHGQTNGWGAVIARQGGADFQQPLLGEPGLGSSGVGAGRGCLALTAIVPAPAFTRGNSVLLPLNATLPRPYNDLAVPGFTTRDVVAAKSSADNGNPLTDLVLRGQGTTALQQAAALKPTFVSVFIGGNDVLGAVATATAISGITLPDAVLVGPRYKTIFETLKTAQGTPSGIALTIPDPTSIAFATGISPVITLAGHTFTGSDGQPLTYLSRKVEKLGGIPTGGVGPVSPIPPMSLVTLNAAALIATGTGIPCAVFSAAGIPAGDPRRANCDKPLPDDLDPATGAPGVVLYPDEIVSIQSATDTLNGLIEYFAGANGYVLADSAAFFADLKANGRKVAGLTITADFLSGGFFSYDGIHPTPLGQVIFARELMHFLNDTFHASLPEPDLYPYLFGSPAGTGAAVPVTPEEAIAAAATLFPEGRWRETKRLFGLFDPPAIVLGGDGAPERDPRQANPGTRLAGSPALQDQP